MRISDWSSDVCSSDLICFSAAQGIPKHEITLLELKRKLINQFQFHRKRIPVLYINGNAVVVPVGKAFRKQTPGKKRTPETEKRMYIEKKQHHQPEKGKPRQRVEPGIGKRSEESREGKDGVSTSRSRWLR